MNAVPFKVTWELHAPVVVPAMPLHLDALLAWARVHQAELAGDRDALALQHDLPLQRHETAGGWCFMASMVHFDFQAPRQQLHMTKRADLDAQVRAFAAGVFGKKKPPFDPSRGLTKGASLQIPQAFARTAWACGVGDIEQVRALLATVTSLGKLRRHGKGAVRAFDVAQWDGAAEQWSRRNLPHDSSFADGSTHALAQQRLHPPYWSKESQMVRAPI